MKIPAWIYIGVITLIGVVFVVVLARAKSDDLNAYERDMVDLAKELGLDEAQFTEDMQSQEVKDKVAADEAEALELLDGRASTPSIFIDGTQYQFAGYESFKSIIESKVTDAETNGTLPVEVVTFTDFNCPACAQFDISKQRLMGEMDPTEVDFVSKHLPFLKESSDYYAYAAEAAGKQDKFHEFGKKIYSKIHGISYEE